MLACAVIASYLGRKFHEKGCEALDTRIYLVQITSHAGISHLIQRRGNGKFGFYYQKGDEVPPQRVDAVFAIYHETHYKNWFGRCKVWLQSKVLGKNAYIVKIKQDGQIHCFNLRPLTLYRNIHEVYTAITTVTDDSLYMGVVSSLPFYAKSKTTTTAFIDEIYGIKHET